MKILLIDNNLAHSEYLSGVLTGKGHRVESVSKIEGLFPKILKGGYELIFVEVTFPDEQSIKLLEDIRNNNLDVIPIAMTEAGDTRLAVQAMDKGAFDYVVKPMDQWYIDIAINRAIRRKQYEVELNNLRDITGRVLEGIPIGVETINKDLVITSWNKGMEHIFGTRKEDVVGKRIFDLFPDFRKKIGERVFKAVMETGEPFNIDSYNHTTKTDKKMVLNLRYSPYKGVLGKVIGIVAIIEDVTKKTQMEHELRQRERLSMIGQLAASVAHEINNPLAIISGNLELLKTDLKEGKPLEIDIDDIQEEVKRCAEVATDLQKLSEFSEPVLKTVDINRVIDETLFLMKAEIRYKRMDVIKKLSSKLLPVKGDESQLEQVFMNIVLLSSQALKRGGKLKVTTRNCDGKENIDIRFSNNGRAIPKRYLQRLFSPFLKLGKSDKRRIGLSLTISEEVLQSHKGSIRVEKKPKGWTTFIIRLPSEERRVIQ